LVGTKEGGDLFSRLGKVITDDNLEPPDFLHGRERIMGDPDVSIDTINLIFHPIMWGVGRGLSVEDGARLGVYCEYRGIRVVAKGFTDMADIFVIIQ
jgi:hypothetical protein